MNTLDLILIIILALAFINGLKKGLVSQITGLISLLLGIWISSKFMIPVSDWLSQYIETTKNIINIISFLIIFIVVILGMNFIAKIVEKCLNIIMLGWLNKLLGGVLGLLTGIIIIGVIITIIDPWLYTPTDNSSVIYDFIKDTSKNIFPQLSNYFNIAKDSLRNIS